MAGTPPCEICGRRPARFVCSRCGRRVCERCFEPDVWLCSSCLEELVPERPLLMVSPLPLSWLVAAVALIVVGMILMAVGVALSGGQGVLLIFPFFVLVGGAGWLTWLSLALLVLLVALAIISMYYALVKSA